MQGSARGGGTDAASGGDDGDSPSTRGAAPPCCARQLRAVCAPRARNAKTSAPRSCSCAAAAPGPAGAHRTGPAAAACAVPPDRRAAAAPDWRLRLCSPCGAVTCTLQKLGAVTCVHLAARLTLHVRVCRASSMLRSLPRTLGRQVLPARRPCAPGRADCMYALCAARPTNRPRRRRRRADAFRRRRALPARRRYPAPLDAALLRKFPRPRSPGACRWQRVRSTCPATSTTTACRRTTTCSSRCAWPCRNGRARTSARCACVRARGGNADGAIREGGNPASRWVCVAVYTRETLP